MCLVSQIFLKSENSIFPSISSASSRPPTLPEGEERKEKNSAMVMENPRSVGEICRDFKGRRAAIIKALTTNVEEFYRQCDPEKENLCLYGYPSEQWEMTLPVEEVPPELPEPALGINFARDGMQEKDWLSLVAVYSDAWLLSVAFYFGARKQLFNMINDLPTIFEVVTGVAKKQMEENRRLQIIATTNLNQIPRSVEYHIFIPISESMTNTGTSRTSRTEQRVGATYEGSESQPKYSKAMPLKDEDDDLVEEEEHGETLCGSCGETYTADEFWICCICVRNGSMGSVLRLQQQRQSILNSTNAHHAETGDCVSYDVRGKWSRLIAEPEDATIHWKR
ncbi:PHD finger protein ALFIN-LIKE 3 [Hibiscus syriacus]|uniref:PHD finger protein ALFIN-LIKE n=1 Tax=Hibiscus syriacus TaxID=106335 RepID=A0A6A2ZJR8_HIBSY|nr:PHD finger protein ALFIN-LIKE 3 [Hibiscus syriacus]